MLIINALASGRGSSSQAAAGKKCAKVKTLLGWPKAIAFSPLKIVFHIL
jgi:hypothetical protein